MVEMVWTRIRIGGTLAADRTSELIETLNGDFSNGDANADEAVRDAIANGEPLSFVGECNFGNPEGVKALCRVLRLTYSQDWDSHPEWNAGGVYWAPEMEQEAEYACASSGHPVLDLRDIRYHLAAGTLAVHLEQLEKWAGSKDFPALTGTSSTHPDDGLVEFAALSVEQKEQVRAMFIPAVPYEQYLYAVTLDGDVVCRRSRGT